TNITATSGTVVGSAGLTVGTSSLVSIAVSPANASISLGTTQQFKATGTFADGSIDDITTSVNWTSSPATVATISDSAPTIGLATSTGTGTTTITATSGQISGSTALTVTPAVLVSLAITPSNPSISLGTTQQFTATGTYSDGSNQNITGSVTWSSASASVAVISNSAGSAGLATSAAQGSTTITAISGSLSASTTITVGAPTLVTLAITSAATTISQGSTDQFTATGTFTDGSTQNLTNSVTWSSSNAAVATINGNGLATGVGVGTTTISAASGSINNSYTLTVSTSGAQLISMTIYPLNPSTGVGATEQFTATGINRNGSTQGFTSVSTWSASNGTVATMLGGVATAISVGSTTIKASYGGFTVSTSLTVIAATLFNATQIMDMPQANGTCLTYLSFQGGLYEN